MHQNAVFTLDVVLPSRKKTGLLSCDIFVSIFRILIFNFLNIRSSLMWNNRIFMCAIFGTLSRMQNIVGKYEVYV